MKHPRSRPDVRATEPGTVPDSLDLLPLVEDCADGIAVFDGKGQYLFANREAERILNRPRAAFLGHTLWEFFPTETGLSVFRQAFTSVARDRVPKTFNAFAPQIERWLQVRLAPCALPATINEADHGVIVYFRDVTERLEAERHREESEARFHRMADSASILIWMSGPDALCKWFNKPWLDFTGRTMDQESGDGWTQGIHTEDLDRCLKTYRSAFDARKPFTTEHRMRRCDGEWRWLLNNGSPRYDDNGSFFGFIGSCVDISDLKQAQAEAARLLAERSALVDKQAEMLAQQRAFLKDVLYAVTDGTFLLCDTRDDLPEPLAVPESAGEARVNTMPLTTSASLRLLRREVQQAALSCGFPEECISDMVTAASEAGMNVVSHTEGKGQARTVFDIEKGIVQIWVEDSGPGIPIDILHRAVLERGWTTQRSLGHGFYLMLKCADCIYLLTGSGAGPDKRGHGTTLVLEKHRNPPTPWWVERDDHLAT